MITRCFEIDYSRFSNDPSRFGAKPTNIHNPTPAEEGDTDVDFTASDLSVNEDTHLQIGNKEDFDHLAPGSNLTLTVVTADGSASHAYEFATSA